MLPSPRPASEPLSSSSPIIESLCSSSERPSERTLNEESSKPRTLSTIDLARAPPRTTSQPPGFGLGSGVGLAAGFGSDGVGLGAGLRAVSDAMSHSPQSLACSLPPVWEQTSQQRLIVSRLPDWYRAARPHPAVRQILGQPGVVTSEFGVGFGEGFGARAGLDAGFGWGFGWGGGRCRCTPGLSNSTL